jgi:hypothetical protein
VSGPPTFQVRGPELVGGPIAHPGLRFHGRGGTDGIIVHRAHVEPADALDDLAADPPETDQPEDLAASSSRTRSSTRPPDLHMDLSATFPFWTFPFWM